jgi:anti-sigma factor RsiW
MKCRGIRNRLALHAGGDLTPDKARGVEAHLEACEACRTEFAAYLESLRQTKRWFDQADTVWNDEAWKEAVGRAVAAGSRGRRDQRPLALRPAWGYAAMVLMAAVLSFLVVRPLPEQESLRGPLSAVSPEPPSQDVISMTLVSQETGLKVQWFLNRNFKLKEDSE